MLSPVLDVLTERYSPNIGIRSYGKDAGLVPRYGAARIRGLQAGGVFSGRSPREQTNGAAPSDRAVRVPRTEKRG
jgi:hypothetical protein